MKKVVFTAAAAAIAMLTGTGYAATRGINMSTNPVPALLGSQVKLTCSGTGDWSGSLRSAQVDIWDAAHTQLIQRRSMSVSGLTATYNYAVPATKKAGQWSFQCTLTDRRTSVRKTAQFGVQATSTSGGGSGGTGGGIAAHQTITSYNGPATCIACHNVEAQGMLSSLHMQWSGPTPNVTNSTGNDGKGVNGINTFCTYARSSKSACYSCHVRADGNAPHPPSVNDIDCLMCHNDTYQRTFVTDPDPSHAETVLNVLGETKTYVFGQVNQNGDYTTVPDYANMPSGTTMVSLARSVHLPTRKSCLRCHAKAGGGDWTKRGDMGANSEAPTVAQDVHMASKALGGADLTCTACHAASGHKIGGRGIDLRETEAPAPKCTNCHPAAPHSDATLNRHAAGQVSCQVCHIRQFGKGGATEMSRDWLTPVWNPTFCSGQGGFVGEEIKVANVKPDYTWFDGTSKVYSVGQTIQPDSQGIYHMAEANGAAFDGKSKIVPIKRHFSDMPLHESGKIVPPAIMWMFMTGDFDQAVQKGMEDQGMTGSYKMVNVDAEMLITHGVEPASMAPTCNDCHDSTGNTLDGSHMVPFGQLGYHTSPAKVKDCTLCHSKQSATWQTVHQIHAKDGQGSGILACTSCHTKEPIGLVKPQSDLCNDCHSLRSWSSNSLHSTHLERGYQCVKCHKF